MLPVILILVNKDYQNLTISCSLPTATRVSFVRKRLWFVFIHHNGRIAQHNSTIEK